MCFIENNDAKVFYDGFMSYAKYKQYNSVFGDHVPMILANALNVDLILIEESDEGLVTIETVQSNQDCRPTPLFLHKRPDHYNAIVPLSIEPLWQRGHAHVDDTLNSDDAVDKPNALLSNLSPLDDSSMKDENPYSISDDPSSQDEGKSDQLPDFLYRLQMHRKAHPKNLLSGSLNINSIRNKFSTVEYILQNAYVDIFGICETKLDHTFPEGQFHVKNYIHYRKDRSSNGGGLMMYFRSDIPQRRRHDLEKIIDGRESGLEILIIETTMNAKERWIYVMGYKPPNVTSSVFIDAFSLMCDLILKESNNVIVLGDYNCNFMSENALKDLCTSFDIHNIVNVPTCHKNSVGTLIDICLVSRPLRFKTALNLDCWLSDFHDFICITTKLYFPRRAPSVIQYRSYKNFVDELFINDLFILSQTMMHCDYNINMCIDFFISHLSGIIDKHAPMKYKKIRQNNVPYMNSELRRLHYQRNMLRNIKNKHPCPENFERYRILRNKCVKAKLKSQRQYFAERCDGGPKNQHFWSTIKPFVNSKYNIKENVILRENDDIVNDAESVAKIFNEYFTQIASDIGFNDPIPDDYDNDNVLISLIAKYDKHPSITAKKAVPRGHRTFEFKHVDINQVYEILVNINTKKATGYDGIPCTFENRCLPTCKNTMQADQHVHFGM